MTEQPPISTPATPVAVDERYLAGKVTERCSAGVIRKKTIHVNEKKSFSRYWAWLNGATVGVLCETLAAARQALDYNPQLANAATPAGPSNPAPGKRAKGGK